MNTESLALTLCSQTLGSPSLKGLAGKEHWAILEVRGPGDVRKPFLHLPVLVLVDLKKHLYMAYTMLLKIFLKTGSFLRYGNRFSDI